MIRSLLALALTGVLLGAVGCGGSGGPATPPKDTIPLQPPPGAAGGGGAKAPGGGNAPPGATAQ